MQPLLRQFGAGTLTVLGLICLSACGDKPRYEPPGPPEPSPRVGAATVAEPARQPQQEAPPQASAETRALASPTAAAPTAASTSSPPSVAAPATRQDPLLLLEERFGIAAITAPGGRPPLDFAKTQDITELLRQLVELRKRSTTKIAELATLRSQEELREAADCLSGTLIEVHTRAHNAIHRRLNEVNKDIETKRRAIARLEQMLEEQRDLRLDELIINAEQAIGDFRLMRGRIEEIEKVQRLVKIHLERLPARLKQLFEVPIEDTATMSGVVARTIQSCLRER